MKRWHRRLIIVCIAISSFFIAAFSAVYAFNDNIVFFFTPSQLIEKMEQLPKKDFRVGGMVVAGSVVYSVSGERDCIRFLITDMKAELEVRFCGFVPALFMEGQGVVASGYMSDGTFLAKELLAKHDENYMPSGVERPSNLLKSLEGMVPH